MTRTCVFESFWYSFSALRTLKVIQFAISWLNSLLSSFVRGPKTETADTILETARGSADAQGREGRCYHQLLPRLLGQHQRPVKDNGSAVDIIILNAVPYFILDSL